MLQSLKRWKWPIVVIGLALVAMLAFAACDDDEEEEEATPTPTAEAEAGELSVTLEQVEGSGVTGSATVTGTDTGTQVVVTMAGLPEGPHANHLHHGTCDAQGEIHVTLDELQASADDDATATTTDFPEEDPDPELSHFEMGHYLAVHAAEGDVISCGNVVSGS